jgi:aminoglycoside 6'-N-acetyltransferase I
VLINKTRDSKNKGWLVLRGEFIPELTLEEHETFLKAFARDSVDFIAFVARSEEGEEMGFAEVSVRNDYVNGCQHRPALFLEGLYTRPCFRGKGVARQLCSAAEQWGLGQGCQEFASDVYLDDKDSLAAHAGLGFEETERVVYFRKKLHHSSN